MVGNIRPQFTVWCGVSCLFTMDIPGVESSSVIKVRQVRDDPEFVQLPADSSELNSIEESWRQLTDAPSSRMFNSFKQLNSTD